MAILNTVQISQHLLSTPVIKGCLFISYNRCLHVLGGFRYGRKQTAEELDMLPEYVYVKENHQASYSYYTWGNTLHGAIGRASFLKPDLKKRQKILSFVWKPHRMGFGAIFKGKDIACGYGFTLFSVDNKDGEPTCFGTGNNASGQIGYHESKNGKLFNHLIEPFSLHLPLENKEKVIKVSAGRAHSLIATNKNRVFSVGDNAYGQCGRPIIENEDYFRRVTYNNINKLEGVEIKQLECGQDSSFFLTSEGNLYSCGWSADGQTGQGHFNNEPNVGQVIGDVLGEHIVKVSCRADCALALNDKGEVFGWGNSEYRQLCSVTDEKQINIARHLPLPAKLGKIKDIASSGSACFVITESGEVYSWGYGHLGTGRNNFFTDSPVNIPITLLGANILSPDTKAESLTCGVSSVAVINSNKHLFMWGKNANGNLGLGTKETQYFPLRVSLIGDVIKVSCGIDHTAALVKNLL